MADKIQLEVVTPERRVLAEAWLRDALLETMPLPPDSSAAGKLIRQIELRTRTGASIVGIERNGSNVINPGPDDELLAGDRVLLLGTETQLAAARTALQGAASAAPARA